MARRRIEPWPIGLALALLAMIASSVAFYVVASRHPDALVVDAPYDHALAYNDRARAERRARELGWDLRVAAQVEGEAARVAVALRDGRGRGLAPEFVVVRRERPAEGGLDREFALEPRDGRGEVTVPLPRPGRWRIVVRAEDGGARLERQVTVWRP